MGWLACTPSIVFRRIGNEHAKTIIAIFPASPVPANNMAIGAIAGGGNGRNMLTSGSLTLIHMFWKLSGRVGATPTVRVTFLFGVYTNCSRNERLWNKAP